MDDLMKTGAVIDCKKNSIYFPEHKVKVNCGGKSAMPRSAMTKAEEVPNFIGMFPDVFVDEIPEKLLPKRKILHRITLKDPTKLIKTSTFKAPQALIPKFKEWIDRQLRAGILKRHSIPLTPHKPYFAVTPRNHRLPPPRTQIYFGAVRRQPRQQGRDTTFAGNFGDTGQLLDRQDVSCKATRRTGGCQPRQPV